jgi:CubicO group peptidase (beta-lactamase class C family)
MVLALMTAAALLPVTGCTMWRTIRHSSSGIDDYKIFPYRELRASGKPFRFERISPEDSLDLDAPRTDTPGAFRTFTPKRRAKLTDFLETNDTVAFLIVRSDTIVFEEYYRGYADSVPSLSFSMAKSFLSILIGCAIDDGYITSVDQVVTEYVPELEETGFEEVTLEALLQMTSGMDYKESDNPFGIHPRFYYGDNLEAMLLELRVKGSPGKYFRYKSGENQLLGLILSRALSPMTITGYMQERIWDPLGMEFGGMWSIDHEPDGLEKTFCCLAARARDYAKLGRLYLHKGDWNGEQIVSAEWVRQSTKIDISSGSAWDYQYQWWIPSTDTDDFMAVGHLGQYVYVSPENDVVIVRLGKGRGKLDTDGWKRSLGQIAIEVGR